MSEACSQVASRWSSDLFRCDIPIRPPHFVMCSVAQEPNDEFEAAKDSCNEEQNSENKQLMLNLPLSSCRVHLMTIYVAMLWTNRQHRPQSQKIHFFANHLLQSTTHRRLIRPLVHLLTVSILVPMRCQNFPARPPRSLRRADSQFRSNQMDFSLFKVCHVLI